VENGKMEKPQNTKDDLPHKITYISGGHCRDAMESYIPEE